MELTSEACGLSTMVVASTPFSSITLEVRRHLFSFCSLNAFSFLYFWTKERCILGITIVRFVICAQAALSMTASSLTSVRKVVRVPASSTARAVLVGQLLCPPTNGTVWQMSTTERTSWRISMELWTMLLGRHYRQHRQHQCQAVLSAEVMALRCIVWLRLIR